SAIRIVGWYEENAGYIDNVHSTLTYPRIYPNEDNPDTPAQEPGNTSTIYNSDRVKKDYNDGDNYGLRAALKIDLNDNWTVTPSVMGEKANYNGSYGYRSTGGAFQINPFNPEEREGRVVQ